MPVSYQIIPEHTYPHQYVQINDNSVVTDAYRTDFAANALMMVFASPKGVDGKVKTITGGLNGFVKEYGAGSFKNYGQPYMNAYAAVASGAATVHCLRVAPTDASYACGALMAEITKIPANRSTLNAINGGETSGIAMRDGSVISVDDTKDTSAASASSVAEAIQIVEEEVTAGFTTVDIPVNEDLVEAIAMYNGEYYETLQDAVDAVGTSGGTVQLIPAAADEQGVIVARGLIVREGYNVVIDLNGLTYSVDPTVGSHGTETNGFQMLKTSTVKIKNGILTSPTAKILLQNYCDLTTENVIVKGTDSPENQYVLSNNNGNTTIGAGTVLKAQTGQVAFDICYTNFYPEGAKVTVVDGAAIDGKIQYDQWGVAPPENNTSLNIKGGYFDGGFDVEDGLEDLAKEAITIRDGSFSFDPSAYMNEDATAKMINGRWVVFTEGDIMEDVAGYKVKFFFVGPDKEITDLEDLADAVDADDFEDGDENTKVVKLFSVAYLGRGSFGKNFRWRIRQDKGSDKNNPYKNYLFDIYEMDNGLRARESFSVSFYDEAIYNGASLYIDDIINSVAAGSGIVKVDSDIKGLTEFHKIITTGLDIKEDYPIETFDFFFLTNKTTGEAIPRVEIITEEEATEDHTNAIAVSTAAGISLIGGDDGSISLDLDPDVRAEALDALYNDAFAGNIDPNIKSKNRFPTTLILDANFSIATKLALASLAKQRGDCMAMIDIGTGVTNKTAIKTFVKNSLDAYLKDRIYTIEAYAGKVIDPVTNKTVTVTSTYHIALAMPQHFRNYNGKHKPMAGNKFGVIDTFIDGTVYPVLDEDLDSEIMDELEEMNVNYAKYNPNQVVVRALQDTRQDINSALSEQNNMLIVLDIKRDAERIAAQFEYEFSEPEEMARFNIAMSNLAAKYADAQVKSISARVDKNDYETEHNWIHIYIELVHKGLVKISIIEIDVNKATA